LNANSAPLVPIPVVCAVIVDATQRVLLAQRPAHKHLGLKWEFPGGKIESHDASPEHALHREIKEELGCDLIINRALPRFTHQYPSIAIEMIPFVCTLSSGSAAPHPHEHRAIAWAPLDTVPSYDLAPADWPVVEQLRTAPPP
jgi:8-oxo-dGTP diphosphatase